MRNFLLLLTVVLITGCAGRMGRSVARFDKTEAVQIDQLIGNNLSRTPFEQQVVYLNARCETRRDGSRQYYLYTEVIPPADFSLQTGESLVINVDGEVLSYAPVGAPTAFTGRKRFITTFYKVPATTLTKLAQSSEARMRVKGTTSVIDKKLSARNIRRFSEFVQKYSIVAESANAPKIGG